MKKLNIIYEDKHLLVVNKPCKLLTINTNQKDKITLYNEVYDYLHKKNQKVFIVNRLDKDTSGLVVFAKSTKVKKLLQDSWNKVIRKYYGVVEGVIAKSDKVESYLIENKFLQTYSTKNSKGKFAQTLYTPISNNKKFTLLEIQIMTGRKNQIRVHMQDINHPIVGDKKYGSKKYNPINRMGLHAYYLEFIHPITKQKLILQTKIPSEFVKLLNLDNITN
jgi:23S rRNA pseudouridine1911/1915/1917 synthase